MRDHSRETPCRARPDSEWSEFRTALAVALSWNTLIDFALRTNKQAAIRTDRYRKGAPRSTDDGNSPPGKNPRDQAALALELESVYKVFTLYCKVKAAGTDQPAIWSSFGD